MDTRSENTDEVFQGADEVTLERYRTLINAIDDGIFQLDSEGHLEAVNERIIEMTGYVRDELLGTHVSKILADENGEAIDRIVSTGGYADGERSERLELAVLTADDERLPCELRVNPVGDEDEDEFRGAVATVRERSGGDGATRIRESPRAAYDSITNVLDEANIGVIVLDETFEIEWIDETIETFLDLEWEQAIGRDKRTVIEETLADRIVEPDSFGDTLLETYAEGTYVDRLECAVPDWTDGQHDERWLEYQSKPIESGEFAGGRVELYYDVTDRKQSEDALRESEEAFHSLVDTVEEYAIFRLDTAGNVISWNEGARQIKGYEREEILGEHFSQFYTADDRSRGVPERNLEMALETGSTEDEGWRIREDGSRFWANVTITPVRADDGTHRGFLKVTRDVTARRDRERELEGELQRILSRISDAFYAVDEEFRFTHVNDRAEELLQHSEEELLGERLWDVFPSAAEIDEVWDAFQTAREQQVTTSYELYYETLGFWIEANLYPSETGISVYFRDVTERRERQQALEESERRYRTLAEHFPNGVVTLFDHDLEYTLAAGRGFDRIPVDPDDLEGRHLRDVWPEEAAEILGPALRSALEGEDRTVEHTYAGREWEIHAVAITDERGDVFAGMTMGQDITERREYERKLEETIAKLEESNERLEQFAYAASHDLQEPLRMVSSYLQLIERRYGDDLDDDGEEFLEFAVDGAERMRRMIDGLLTYSRVETRGGPLEPTDLDTVFEEVLTDLHLQMAESNAEITADSLPWIEGDADQLRQVFQNLLLNAITYSGDQPPRVHVSAERRDDEWVLSVHDEGIGIDLDDQDRVFEVFERLHSHEKHSGTGIGLALCQRIVERHGGEMWVDSEPGEGSTFSFTLSAAEAPSP
ncbi:PAS domain S-box protein [Natrarchaeobius sp. A-rgal3]|uniref:PAS domain S-box protein n=1 Tax=Natrarchaeobius versutus TaxID=1679078 RepID=UPI003510C5E1